MRLRSVWLSLQVFWALAIGVLEIRGALRGTHAHAIVLAAYFFVLAGVSVAAWREASWAWQVLPFQLGGSVLLFTVAAGHQVKEVLPGRLQTASPRALFLVAGVLSCTLLPAYAFLVLTLYFRRRRGMAAA